MGWTEMREMAGSGATYANHGAGHVSLIARDASENEADWLARIRADVVKGRQRLSEELEPEPRVFAYPYGEYNLVAANLLAELGYRSFGQQSGAVDRSSDRRALPRFPINEAYGEMDQFRIKAASLPLPVTGILPWDPEVSTRMPTLEITLGASDARLAELACYVGGQGRVEVEWLQAKTRFRTAPANPLPDGRQRVNCTAPTAGGRYRWFSHSWFVRPR
jgi:peptidoglycan/xylan/chitin deacetylase (PgdA/CDA1 family)